MASTAPQTAEDELQIRNLIARLTLATDQGDLKDYASAFTEDALLEMRGTPEKPSLIPPTSGRSAILAGAEQRRAERLTGPGTGVVHALMTCMVSVAGDTATAQSHVMIYRNAQMIPEPVGFRVYHDRFVQIDAEWKLASRSIALLD